MHPSRDFFLPRNPLVSQPQAARQQGRTAGQGKSRQESGPRSARRHNPPSGPTRRRVQTLGNYPQIFLFFRPDPHHIPVMREILSQLTAKPATRVSQRPAAVAYGASVPSGVIATLRPFKPTKLSLS